MPTALVTGSNRGIGLEFVRQYAAEGWRVHATCRDPARAGALQAVKGDVHIHALDVREPKACLAVARALGGDPIDELVNNAGILGARGMKLGALDYDMWMDVLRVNVIGPIAVTEALVDNVAKSGRKLVVAVSSGMGSIARNESGVEYKYRSSKAALNMAMKCLAIDIAPKGIVCAAISPGWVQTDMGGAHAAITPEQSVTGMRKVMARLEPADSGKFFGHEGNEIPW